MNVRKRLAIVKQSLVALHLILPVRVAAQDRSVPAFLFAGQSNMIGHPDQAGNIYTMQSGEPGLSLETLVPILTENRPADQKETKLQKEIRKIDSNMVIRVGVTEVESAELISLEENNPELFETVQTPLSNAQCSFLNLRRRNDNAIVHNFQQAVNVSPESNCGYAWGPELNFAHLFTNEKSIKYTLGGRMEVNEFAIAKVASGGSELYRDWSRKHGIFWKYLVSTIRQSDPSRRPCGEGIKCNWKGIVWFQGENDTFHKGNADTYAGNLTSFIADLRKEVFSQQPDNFERPIDVPVVIVQIGQWRTNGDLGRMVATAQADFVSSDKGKSALVVTEDLSSFYHYEAAAVLIIGARIGNAMESITPTYAKSTSPCRNCYILDQKTCLECKTECSWRSRGTGIQYCYKMM